jgi:hypothetical protein
MPAARPAFRASAVLLTMLALAACGGERFTGLDSGPGSGAISSQPSAPPAAMAGRWLFSSPNRGQCSMTFGAANATASEGTIAPEGGCPGKFFTSRKWTYDQNGLTMRDHTGQPLAQLSGAGGRFDGKATTGEPVALGR